MVDIKTREMINELVNLLKENGIKVEKILLYDSYAAGLSHVDSDVDLTIVSPDFGKDRFEERKFLFKLA